MALEPFTFIVIENEFQDLKDYFVLIFDYYPRVICRAYACHCLKNAIITP